MKQTEREPRNLRSRVLALLLLAYIFNFLDRNVAGILAVPIRTEFRLSDTVLSELGVAFGLFYAVIAIPVAWLADRRSRANIIAISVAVWSLFSAGCGLVSSFTQLVIARTGVAIGEAGAIAPSRAFLKAFGDFNRAVPARVQLTAKASDGKRKAPVDLLAQIARN